MSKGRSNSIILRIRTKKKFFQMWGTRLGKRPRKRGTEAVTEKPDQEPIVAL